MNLSRVVIVSSQMPLLHENPFKKEKILFVVVVGGDSVDAVVLFMLCF